MLPFWRAVLSYRLRADTPEEELNDPHLSGPVSYFNQMDAPRPQRTRIHIDVWAPHDQAELWQPAARQRALTPLWVGCWRRAPWRCRALSVVGGLALMLMARHPLGEAQDSASALTFKDHRVVDGAATSV